MTSSKHDCVYRRSGPRCRASPGKLSCGATSSRTTSTILGNKSKACFLKFNKYLGKHFRDWRGGDFLLFFFLIWVGTFTINYFSMHYAVCVRVFLFLGGGMGVVKCKVVSKGKSRINGQIDGGQQREEQYIQTEEGGAVWSESRVWGPRTDSRNS